ncbi:hypothetical protein [Thaumasiovibrio subtropicus]|uniref:hypothetical protein n=1 Tax=Thaumasiovibrio subtropicus TaxID=1891207 RepID=UPI000B34DB33|nr:hypothetical protein [Thaumasiovibrio subtropicus]
MKQILAPRQQVQFTAVGEFIYVERAPGKVRIRTQRGEYELTERAQIKDAQLSGLITVENMANVEGTIELRYGYGEYVPPNDGQFVSVVEIPEMTIAKLPPVVVETMPDVVISEMPETVVSAMPPVAVESLPSIKLENGQAVRIYATSPVLSKPVGGTSVKTQTLTITSGAATLAADSARAHVLIKAPSSNAAPVLLGDYPIEPGEKQTLATFGELQLTGTDNDTLHIIEVMR